MGSVPDAADVGADDAARALAEIADLRRRILGVDDQIADMRRQVENAVALAAESMAQYSDLAQRVARLDNIFELLAGDDRIKVDRDPQGYIRLRYQAPYYEGFDITLTGTTARVRRGRLVVPLVGTWESNVDSGKDYASVTLSGASPAWIYATHQRAHGSGLGIAPTVSSTYPVFNASEYRIPLYEVRNDGAKWYVYRSCLHDILFGGI